MSKMMSKSKKVFSKEFSCEHVGSRWISESNEEKYFYEFKENN